MVLLSSPRASWSSTWSSRSVSVGKGDAVGGHLDRGTQRRDVRMGDDLDRQARAVGPAGPLRQVHRLAAQRGDEPDVMYRRRS